jgi:hypothetical protein
MLLLVDDPDAPNDGTWPVGMPQFDIQQAA